MHILLFANCITTACRARRDNARYDAPAGRQKVLLLADYLVALGHTAEIVSPSYAKRMDTEFIETIAPGLTVRHAPTRALLGLAPARRALAAAYNRKIVRAHAQRRDVLVCAYNYHREYAAALLCAANECGLKTLLEYEDGLFLHPAWQTPKGEALEKAVYAATSGCLLVNAGLQTRIQTMTAKPPPCFVLPGLPDLHLLKRQPARPPPGNRRLLFAGNFGREQGFGQLRQWIEQLPEGMELDITGRADEAETRELRELVARQPRARYHGFLPTEAFEKLFDDADACILLHDPVSPLIGTQFPSKFFDYLSRNKRIVSAPDARLERFRGLSHLVVLEDFPRDLPQLPEILRAAPPPRAQEVQALGEQLRRQLGEFLAKF